MPQYQRVEPYPLGADATEYRLLSRDFVSIERFGDREILKVDPQALTLLAREALTDVNFLLRASHLAKLRAILDDPEASDNDRFVADTLLKNAVIAAQGKLPSCQDTGTAIVIGEKGERVWTGGDDEAALEEGIFRTYQEQNLRYSQMAPVSMFDEKNTGNNLPAQIDIHAASGGPGHGDEYRFLFLAKGGGSANKTYLFQETKSLLNEKSLEKFLREKLFSLGTAACPPYHLAVVIGGTSAEATLKAVKLASTGYYDSLPIQGQGDGKAFRDPEWEERIVRMARESRIGAQFGGKYFVHDVRVLRLPRHAASCPVGIGVSCSADRNIKAKITRDGIFLERLERDPGRFIPADRAGAGAGVGVETKPVPIDLNQPMEAIRAELSKHPIKTRLSLTGPLIVARDVAHARIKQMLDAGKPMPQYLKDHPVYYAGPAKTPQGMASGSFGPTTAGRMDGYVDEFMAKGGSFVMLAKGNRSPVVREACAKHKGFYLGSIGGPAAILAQENILKVEVVDFEDLGMEAVRRIWVKDFPAFTVVDDKGNDFFQGMGAKD
ncbi:MAG: fumarate hydratase [Fibrobacteres bacterium]|nr:fumarate hydratase [Fibrobacterota bacterium]